MTAEDKGWDTYKPTDRDVGRVMVLGGYEVDRTRIREYYESENVSMLNFFYRYKCMGWPYAGGWAEQAAKFVDIVELLESESGKRLKKK